jgi:hypothetical protein
MIVLLSRVSWDQNYFFSVLEEPHSMPFLILLFLLRNLLLFCWVYFPMLLVFSLLQPSYFVLCTNCFDDSIPWRGSILVMSFWYPGDFLYLNGQFLLEIWEISWYYFVEHISPSSIPMIHRFSLMMHSLNSCLFLSQLGVFCLGILCIIFCLISILSFSPETLSSTYSTLLKWLSIVFFI